MTRLKITECRSCYALAVWMKTRKKKNILVDADTVDLDNDRVFDPQIHTAHFATCPDADRWRKPRRPTP